VDRLRVIGSLITLSGVLYVSSADVSWGDLAGREHLAGNTMVMLAGVSWSLFAVAQRRAPRQRNLFRLLAPIFAVAALTTTPLLLARGAWHNPGGVVPTAMLLVVIVLCTISVYVVYARCQELVDVSVLAIVLASIRVFAVSFAWLLLSEELSTHVVVGGAVILAGVLVISTHRPARDLLESTAIERAL
jgi:drug/metabolite transporter (DMT)-like permease